MNSSAEPTKAINFNSSASLLTKDLIKDKRTCKRDLVPIFQSFATGELEQIKHISFYSNTNSINSMNISSYFKHLQNIDDLMSHTFSGRQTATYRSRVTHRVK